MTWQERLEKGNCYQDFYDLARELIAENARLRKRDEAWREAIEIFAARIWDVKYEADKMFMLIGRELGVQNPDDLLKKYRGKLYGKPILAAIEEEKG